jgi:spore coat polysaccharide biosynthesis predicted glycosyltransferase SpsG
MKEKELAIQNYKRFCSLEGSDYIASEFALETILKIIKLFDVQSILELGLGIGSISDTVLQYGTEVNKKLSYVGTENNEFCLSALRSNIIGYEQLLLFSKLNQIKNKSFDLIIIDGYDESLLEIVAFCKKHTIIFIEGDRKGQLNNIREIFPKNSYVNVITLNKNKPYSHSGGNIKHYVGGGQLIFINPTFKMKLYWFQQKATTFIINKIRTI